MVLQLQRRLFTTDEYFRMVKAGIFGRDDRVELLEGEIVEMPPIGSQHAGTLNALIILVTPLSGRAVIASQNPLNLGATSAPQPDIALLRPRGDYYRDSHPQPADVLLLIEVADSTLLRDQRIKAPLYAAAGVPEFWIVNLTNQTVEIHRQPSEAGYLASAIARRGESIAPLAFPDLSLAVDDILG